MKLANMAGRIENLVVRPGSLAIVLTGIVLAVLQGLPKLGVLQGLPINGLLISNLLLVSMILVIPLFFVPHGKIYEGTLGKAADYIQDGFFERMKRTERFNSSSSL